MLERAHRLGLVAYGLSFHVGSQQRNPRRWDGALGAAAGDLPRAGGARHRAADGQPRRRLPDQVPEGRAGRARAYGEAIFRALRKHFGNRIPETIIEPGRGMVGNAGMIEAEVVLISKKSAEADEVRWVYLDIGKFDGLAETMDEAIRYPIRTARDGDATEPCVHRRADLRQRRRALREGSPTRCRSRSEIGAKVLIEGTGAYTTTYSAVGFNGFPPLQQIVI